MGSYFTIRCYKLDYASACMRTALLLPWALIQRDRGRARGQGVRGRGPLKLNTLKHLHTLRSPKNCCHVHMPKLSKYGTIGQVLLSKGANAPCPCLWATMLTACHVCFLCHSVIMLSIVHNRFLCEVLLEWAHNHSICNQQALQQLRVKSSTKEMAERLFAAGVGVAGVRRIGYWKTISSETVTRGLAYNIVCVYGAVEKLFAIHQHRVT